MVNWKDIIKRLMGKGSPIVSRDERGIPVRKATPDDLELEQYAEEDRRERIKKLLALKRRERFTRAMTYGGYALNIPQPKPLPKFNPKIFKGSWKKKKKVNILNSKSMFFK